MITKMEKWNKKNNLTWFSHKSYPIRVHNGKIGFKWCYVKSLNVPFIDRIKGAYHFSFKEQKILTYRNQIMNFPFI